MLENAPSRSGAPELFRRIATRYDLINRVLSLGMDAGWRRRAALAARVQPGERLLDVATGTADFAMELLKCQPLASVTAIDPVEQMREIGNSKLKIAGLKDRVTFLLGKAESLPFPDASFDVVTIGFGIRNTVDPEQALREMRRVLKPQGRLIVLEFSLPENGFVRSVYLFYLRRILPLVGGLLSGDVPAYRYLNKTIETFPSGEVFVQMLKRAGFKNIERHTLLFGGVTIYKDQPFSL